MTHTNQLRNWAFLCFMLLEFAGIMVAFFHPGFETFLRPYRDGMRTPAWIATGLALFTAAFVLWRTPRASWPWIAAFSLCVIAVPVSGLSQMFALFLFLLPILFVEWLFPAQKWRVFGRDSLINAMHLTLFAGYTIAGFFAVDAAILKQTTPWGLTANGVPTWLQAIIVVLVADLVYYWDHRLRHILFWPFHKYHHSTVELSSLAVFRINPLDVLFLLRWLFIVPFFLLGGIEPMTILVSTATRRTFIYFFSHMNVDFPKLPVPFWAYVVSTPNWHAIHHEASGDSNRCNYGGIFVFWDILFGTFRPPGVRPTVFGVDAKFQDKSTLEKIFLPFDRPRAAARRRFGSR